jgi:hypothetical protein
LLNHQLRGSDGILLNLHASDGGIGSACLSKSAASSFVSSPFARDD